MQPHPEKFEALIRNATSRAFPGQRYVVSYAEHPYVRLHSQGRKIDIVPAYKIKKITGAADLKSAVDRQ